MSVFREVLYNDGEGIDFGDANDAQRQRRAYEDDAIISPAAPLLTPIGGTPFTYHDTAYGVPIAVGGSGAHLYARRMGGAPFRSTSSDISNAPGLLMQSLVTADPDGAGPKLLSYWVGIGELLTTFAAPDAVQPRIDLVCLKIETEMGDLQTRDFKDATTGVITSQSMNKQRRTKVTMQIVQGSPAVTPTEPACPAGFARWYAVTITPGGSLAITRDDIQDYRVPLGVQESFVDAPAVHRNDFEWDQFLNGDLENAGAAVAYLVPSAHGHPESARLIAVALRAVLAAGSTVALGYLKRDLTGFVQLRDLTSSFVPQTSGEKSATGFENENSSDGPFWANGRRAPVYRLPADPISTMLALKVNAVAGSKLIYARFRFAGGW